MATTVHEEPVARFSSPMPPGYIFVPKGDVYITKNCRKLTYDADQTVYLVKSAKKVMLGIRVPLYIFTEVRKRDADSKDTRAQAVQKKDDILEDKARVALKKSFPRMPEGDIDHVLKHTLKKRSGRVGRSTDMPIEMVVELAVRAHIRHKYTEYDKALNNGKERDETRRMVQPAIDKKVTDWGGRMRSPLPTPARGMRVDSPKRIPIRTRIPVPRKGARKRRLEAASTIKQKNKDKTKNKTKNNKGGLRTFTPDVPVRASVTRRRSLRLEGSKDT